MPKTREPAWWMRYALVPVMGGLLVLEFRAPLSPGGHKGVQVGIVLFIYGLVWLWLRANAFRLLWSDQGAGTAERAIEARSAAIRSRTSRLPIGSSPLIGSSRNTTSGSLISA